MMNRFFTLLFAASCLTAVGQVPDYAPTDGLVAWYPLSENGEDVSGNGHDLIAVGAPSWTTDDAGSYCDFDGEGTHFYHPQALFPEVDELTISFWARIDDFSTGNGVGVLRPIISKHYSSSDGSFILYPFEDRIVASQLSGPYTIELGVWHHMALVVSEVTKLYINGELVNSAQSPANGWNQTDHPFMIGGWLNPPWWSNWSNIALTFDGGMSSVGLWSRELSQHEISQLLDPFSGCAHEQACNYNESANLDDGTCEFVSCHCLTGTVWDEGLGGCIGDGSADINFDGCVQLNDLLDLLSAYGNCGAEEVPWECGDPLEYQGYGYATVQIVEQCWFAENLRAESYRNGDDVPSGLTNPEWENTIDGAVVVYGKGEGSCNSYSPDGNACDEVWSLNEYGRLYNWYAVDDDRGLCPSGWHIPLDEEWVGLADALGGASLAGANMKDTFGWQNGENGNNESGFSGLPGGYRASSGIFWDAGHSANWHSSSPIDSTSWYHAISANEDNLLQGTYDHHGGFSVRCIKDAD